MIPKQQKESWHYFAVKIYISIYCGEDCMKRLCVSLRENAINVINFEKEKTLLLTVKELK